VCETRKLEEESILFFKTLTLRLFRDRPTKTCVLNHQLFPTISPNYQQLTKKQPENFEGIFRGKISEKFQTAKCELILLLTALC